MSGESAEFPLTVPASVAADPQAIELMRMWWSRGEPVMAIKPAFQDPGLYGQMLAIAARNIAYVYHATQGVDEDATYRQVLNGLENALSGPGFKTIAETKSEA